MPLLRDVYEDGLPGDKSHGGQESPDRPYSVRRLRSLRAAVQFRGYWGIGRDYHDQFMLRKLGMEALKEKLGIVGAVRFIRQFSEGSGDYTKDRDAFHANLTFDEIVEGSMEMEKKRKIRTV